MATSFPGGTSSENIQIQIQNYNNALPILDKLQNTTELASNIIAQISRLGNELGDNDIGNKVSSMIHESISKNPEFESLVQIGVVSSVEELLNPGVINTKINFINQKIQEAQRFQSELAQQSAKQIGG